MKRQFQLLCIAMVAMVTLSTTTYAQEVQAGNSSEYKVELTRYMKLSGGDYGFKTMIDQIIGMSAPNLSQEKKDEITKKAISNLITEILPLYEKNITLADLKAMNKFYESDVAKRVIGAQPALTAEMMTIGQQWAMSLQALIIEASK